MSLTRKEMKENQGRVEGLLQTVERPGIDKVVEWLSSSDYYMAPASTMHHGNYEGGLAEHSYTVYKEFKRQAEHYGLEVSEDSIILTSLLHDSCKVDFYVKNELKSGKTSESKPYKTEDCFPLGHGEKSVALIQRCMQLTAQEALIIRWHMGMNDPSWEDYSEKVERQYPEVTLFAHVDKEVSMIYKK